MATHTFVPRSSLLRGVARVIDLFGGLDRGVRRVSSDNAEPLTGDGQAVAGYLYSAVHETSTWVGEVGGHDSCVTR